MPGGRPLRYVLVWLFLACPAMAAPPVPDAAPSAPPMAVTVVPVLRAEIVETATVTGSIVPREEVLVSPQVEGLAITEILVEEGDRVAAGQVLARLSRDTLLANQAQFQAQIARSDASAAQARAQILQGRANLAQAQSTLQRGQKLLATGDTSRETYEQRQASAEVAAAQVAAADGALAAAEADHKLAEAQLAELRVRLGRTDIRAPVAGIVSRRVARLGAVVSSAGDPLFRIVEDGVLELEANVPETLLARLKPGQPAEVAITGQPAPRHGAIRLVSPEVGLATRLGRVRVAIDNSQGLAVGGFGRALVELARADGPVVPLSAVLMHQGGAEVQAVVDGIVQTRKVRLGLRDAQRVQILSGLAEGESVVAISASFVRGGDRITPVPSAGF